MEVSHRPGGAWQSAHRGGGVGTPRAGAARAAHPAAGTDTRSGKPACLRACGLAATPFGVAHFWRVVFLFLQPKEG